MSRVQRYQPPELLLPIREVLAPNAAKAIASAEHAAGRPCSPATAKRIAASQRVPLGRRGLVVAIYRAALRRQARLDRIVRDLEQQHAQDLAEARRREGRGGAQSAACGAAAPMLRAPG